MSAFSCTGITKSYSGTQVLFGIDLSVEAGEVRGVIGENGSGKSTTMNIIGGVTSADGGTMTLNGAPYRPQRPSDAADAGIGFVHQELNVFRNLSVADNLAIGRFPRRGPLIDQRAKNRTAEAALERVGLAVPPSRLAGALAPGERQLLEIAKVLSQSPRVMIFDEPTTSLTAPECDRLFAVINQLKSEGIAILFISHVMSDVRRLSENITVLRDGHVALTSLTGDITPEEVVAAMVGRDMGDVFPPRAPAPAGAPILVAEGLSQPGMLENISLELRPGEILGVSGLMGSGRTELARTLFGLDPHDGRGAILYEGAPFDPTPELCVARGIAFLTEDRRHEGLLMPCPAQPNLDLVSLAAERRFGIARVRAAFQRREAERMRTQMTLKTADLDTTPVSALSGGNQQKVVLGKWLVNAPKVILLDEPTRGVDVGAKGEIYRTIAALAETGLAVILISSELEELTGLAHRILVMRRGEVVGRFEADADGPGAGFDREAIMGLATGAAEATA